jgi:exonuclease SbcC
MLQAAERDVSSQALLQADQRELGRRLETLSAQVDRDSGRRQELERTSVRYRQRLQAVVSAGGVRARWKTLAAEIRQLESTILDRQVKLSQMKHALADIEAIASEAGITASPGVVSWQRAGQVIEILSAQIGKLQLEEEKSLQIRERAKLARLLDLDVRGLREQLDVQEEKRATLDRGCQHVDLIIQRARSLRTAAIEAKSDLLNQAFTGTLNGLWREFFDRLVRTERFHPEMSQPTTIRNVIHANVCGVTSNSEPFLNIASVLSSGNLNTAALSLFFALHVMDRTSHSILVLDDPVQSVDDVHVSQMAILLRSLMTPIGRQSVVAAHDRDLFDYLSLELAPTEEGRSLITIELQRSTPESDVTIIQKTKTWTPSIRFGT